MMEAACARPAGSRSSRVPNSNGVALFSVMATRRPAFQACSRAVEGENHPDRPWGDAIRTTGLVRFAPPVSFIGSGGLAPAARSDPLAALVAGQRGADAFAAAVVVRVKAVLAANPGMKMHGMLPDRWFVPQHYHITEVGRVRKDLIDCGGAVRSTTTCLLQVWVADDTDHRLETTKLATIMDIARPVLESDESPVEVEFDEGTTAQYPVGGAEITPAGVLFLLGTKHTACLAPEKCAVDGTGCW